MSGRYARLGLALGLLPLLTGAQSAGKESAAPKCSNKPLVCSIARGVECNGNLDCAPPTDRTNAPTFIHVDPEKKVVTLLAPAKRRGEVTRIQAMDRSGGLLTLSGVEAGRGWSLVITEETGNMTLTVADPDAAFVVFGRCLCETETKP